MKNVWTYVITNWKTSLAGFVAFVISVPQAMIALHQLQAGQKVDWAGTAVCLVIAAVGLSAKDSTTHSTQLEVAKASAVAVAAK